MIGVILSKMGQFLEIRIEGNNVFFRESNRKMWTDISGLKLSREGVIKEFPELSTEVDWREKAISKFKEKIKSFPSEILKVEYVIEDLKAHGYTAEYLQHKGQRPIKLKDGGK